MRLLLTDVALFDLFIILSWMFCCQTVPDASFKVLFCIASFIKLLMYRVHWETKTKKMQAKLLLKGVP